MRHDFVSAFAACKADDFEALDDLETLACGQALVTKALTFYFPGRFLPIFSAQHLRRFADILDPGSGAALAGTRTWQANRWLLAKVRDSEAFAGWSPHEVMHFLYETYDPRVPPLHQMLTYIAGYTPPSAPMAVIVHPHASGPARRTLKVGARGRTPVTVEVVGIDTGQPPAQALSPLAEVIGEFKDRVAAGPA